MTKELKKRKASRENFIASARKRGISRKEAAMFFDQQIKFEEENQAKKVSAEESLSAELTKGV